VPESILLDITAVIVLGIGAQWLAWRFRLPSILLLLLAGFLAGPVLGILSPSALQGDWLFAFVSVSIGIILFEGGLSLRLSELREVGTAVRNLISVGVFITWALTGVAAHFILGFPVPLAILIGAILTVTGPTVIVPLLRHIRPKGRVGTVAKWEGITIDPVGAILAVLVLETLVLLNEPAEGAAEGSVGVAGAIEHVAIGLGLEIFVALGVSVAATGLLIVVLRQRLVPDYLRNGVTLMVVVAAFVLSNVLQHESGLLTTTLMGIALANQSYVSVQRIVEFKENLQVLLIGSLFILLSARLELSAISYIDTRALIFLAILVVLVRPLAVFISSLGTQIEWEEQAFLAWLAPRGIVAAAVASLFAYQLEGIYPQSIEPMVPIVFLVIVGTVAIYGLTAPPLARWLGLADPNPEGILFVGAGGWVRRIAKFVQDLGYQVLLIDTNADQIERAQDEGLPAQRANALSESALDDISLSGIGRLLIVIPNDEAASLTALHFSEIFESTDIYQLGAQAQSRNPEEGTLPRHLQGRPLFGETTNYESLRETMAGDHEVRLLQLADDFASEEQQEYYNYEDLRERYKDYELIPLFIIDDTGTLNVVSEISQFVIRPGDRLIALVNMPEDGTTPIQEEDEEMFELEDPNLQGGDGEQADSTPAAAVAQGDGAPDEQASVADANGAAASEDDASDEGDAEAEDTTSQSA
jgi:NhaP-type Na+/H+ or K+/H+ antiporter